MTQGFYEQLGVPTDASFDALKAAYGRAVSHLLRRRDATVSQGGDTSALDLARAQLDEAWTVLADASSRRRYDAMLALVGDGAAAADLDALWEAAAGALLGPRVAAAAELVDATTHLGIGPLPQSPRPGGHGGAPQSWPTAPSGSGTAHDFGDRRAVGVPSPPPRAPAVASVQPKPYAPSAFAPSETPATIVPADPATSAGVPAAPSVLSAQELADLTATHGPSGALLRAVRERRGLSLDQVWEETHVTRSYLEAVESETYEALPSTPVFVRGYVGAYARMLGLDADWVVAGYMRRFGGD